MGKQSCHHHGITVDKRVVSDAHNACGQHDNISCPQVLSSMNPIVRTPCEHQSSACWLTSASIMILILLNATRVPYTIAHAAIPWRTVLNACHHPIIGIRCSRAAINWTHLNTVRALAIHYPKCPHPDAL